MQSRGGDGQGRAAGRGDRVQGSQCNLLTNLLKPKKARKRLAHHEHSHSQVPGLIQEGVNKQVVKDRLHTSFEELVSGDSDTNKNEYSHTKFF